MRKKVLLPLMIVGIAAMVAVVTVIIAPTRKSTTIFSADPLQTEVAALSFLPKALSAQANDEALIPEIESTLIDLESDTATISPAQALDDTGIANEGQSLNNLESNITTSQLDETAANETSNTLLDTTQ